jgi:hypothetical protein
MTKIIAKNNLKTLEWSVDFSDIIYDYADIFIGFVDESPVIEFKDLKFKYELLCDNNIKQYGVYPPPGVRYLLSDQPYLISERLNLTQDKNYELYLWAENDGNISDRKIIFKTLIPPQPYQSWIWNGESWIAPVPYPEDDEKYYQWNEEFHIWDEIKIE